MIAFKNLSSKEKGILAEEMAVNFLRNKGFTILKRNWYLNRMGEIDIIALKDKTLNFVEVKSLLKEEEHFNPEHHFSFKKFLKLTKLANFYANNSKYDEWIISLIAVVLNNFKIRYYENIKF